MFFYHQVESGNGNFIAMLTLRHKISLGKRRKRSRSVAARPRLSELEDTRPVFHDLPSVFSVFCDSIDFPQGYPVGL